jgi:hypothetical protein
MELVGWAIYFAVLSGLVAAALLIAAFLAALVGFAQAVSWRRCSSSPWRC